MVASLRSTGADKQGGDRRRGNRFDDLETLEIRPGSLSRVIAIVCAGTYKLWRSDQFLDPKRASEIPSLHQLVALSIMVQ